MNKNKKSIYKLYKTKTDEHCLEITKMQVISSIPLIFVSANQIDVFYKGDVSGYINSAILSSIPLVGVTFIAVIIQSINDKKISKICKLINNKTHEKVDFGDANVSISGFQEYAKETNITFEFNNFYIEECIKDYVYKCGLYYSDGGFTDLTDEVSDIVKRRTRRKSKSNK